ncbi:unnamed protein product [Chrysoparadoxa australica]
MHPEVKCVLILDEEGSRVSTKYYARDEFPDYRSQLEFERKLFKKAKASNSRNEADLVLMEENVAVFRGVGDIHMFVVGSDKENELILMAVLEALYESLSVLLRGQVDRRTMLENLALVLLTVDELVDAGKILEIDPSAIANRVLMRGAEGGQGPASELTIQQAILVAREEFIKRMGT